MKTGFIAILALIVVSFPAPSYSFKLNTTDDSKEETITRYSKTRDSQRSIVLREHLDNIKKRVFPEECIIPKLNLTPECKFQYYKEIYGSMKAYGKEDYNSKDIDKKCAIKQPEYPKICDKYFESMKQTHKILLSMPEVKWDSYVDALLRKHAKR